MNLKMERRRGGEGEEKGRRRGGEGEEKGRRRGGGGVRKTKLVTNFTNSAEINVRQEEIFTNSEKWNVSNPS